MKNTWNFPPRALESLRRMWKAFCPKPLRRPRPEVNPSGITNLISLTIEALKEEDKIAREQVRTIARQENEIERLRVAVHAAEAQLTVLSNLRHQLESLVSTANSITAMDLNLTSADQVHADQKPVFLSDWVAPKPR